MSEPLRIGLVAEGPTDYEIINAALLAVLPVPFVMTLLQPENTQPQFGGGWGGVLKWCHAASRRHNVARLPKAQRIKKTVADYRRFAPVVTAQWAKVKAVCSQAERFEQCAKDIVC